MLKKNSKKLLRLSAALIILSIIFSLFASCAPDTNMASKDEILENVESFNTLGARDYQYVQLYLHDLGIKNFNASKFLWVEKYFQAYYNFADGLPKTSEHARLTAKAFAEEYYDKIDVTDRDEVTNALLTCYVNSVGDKYSVYRTPTEHEDYDTDMSGKFGGIGVVAEYDHKAETIMVTTVYIDSPAESAGIMVGDYIIGVDGKNIEDVGYLNMIDFIRGEIGTNVTVKLKRGDNVVEVVATRAEIEEKTVDFKITEDNYGYVQIVGFKGNTYAQFVAAIDTLEASGVDGIIFDLRGNPGGYVDAVCYMLSYLIPSGHTIVSYKYKGMTTQAIKSQNDIHPTKTDANGQTLVADHKVSLPMVVICNEYTASAGELFTAAIRDYTDMGILNGRIVGKTTYGKGIMQSSFTYSDTSSITMTVAYYNPPCGENYQDIGVSPDEGLAVDNEIIDDVIVDKQLEAAEKELKALINSK